MRHARLSPSAFAKPSVSCPLDPLRAFIATHLETCVSARQAGDESSCRMQLSSPDRGLTQQEATPSRVHRRKPKKTTSRTSQRLHRQHIGEQMSFPLQHEHPRNQNSQNLGAGHVQLGGRAFACDERRLAINSFVPQVGRQTAEKATSDIEAKEKGGFPCAACVVYRNLNEAN